MNNYEKFKFLLEYFVSHLEWVVNKDKKHIGFSTYIDPLIKNGSFKKAGRGWKRESIQQQVTQWENYNNNIVCINITATNYKGTSSYLNWDGTWINVRPRWDKNHINKLYISQEENNSAPAIIETDINDLGLFDKKKTNDKLIVFFNTFYGLINKYNIMKRAEKYISLIESNHNLILTGAPGTGKTYLAKQIAQQMIFGKIKEKMTPVEEKQLNEQCGFVQFHPSYDYTDFVEGLRPIQDEDGNVGFERRDGIFKEFCKRAVESTLTGGSDNFNNVWDQLINYLEDNIYIDIPLLTGARNIRIELNSYGTGLTERLYSDDSSDGLSEKVKGHSKFFTKEQLYNIYRGLKGVPSGGHDNYRKAIVDYLKKHMGLEEYSAKKENKNNEIKYVFIIDEINRGEISKIFGELFFSIDPGYRGKEKGKVNTQYQNLVEDGDAFYDGFYVPENVYIIGTMNDIDRSVESMDFAFRRRFAFKEITAEESKGMLKSDDAWGKDSDNNSLKPSDQEIETIKNKMDALNNLIWHKAKDGESEDAKCIEGFSSAYHIGASYFLKLANYKREDNGSFDYNKLWDNHLEGLLREYMRGMQGVEEKIAKLKEAYNNPQAADKNDTGDNQ